MKSALRILALAFSFVLVGSVATPPGVAQDQSTQNPPPAQAAPQQDQSQQGQQTEKEKKKKKGGGFFGGLKAVAGSGSEQQEATRTAGSKSAGEPESGQSIGDVTPSAADRQAVSGMEGYSIPAPEVKKFQDDGQLKSK